MTERNDPLITVKEAAERIGVHEKTLRLWVNKGAVPYARVGPSGSIRLRESDLVHELVPRFKKTRVLAH